MQRAVVFNDSNAFDFESVRNNVIRIPEVSLRLSEAQSVWDKFNNPEFHFKSFLSADNKNFLGNIRLKKLVAAIVQVGLFDRYIRYHGQPQFVVGCDSIESALKVCSGVMTLGQMMMESGLLNTHEVESHLQVVSDKEPVLSGVSLSKYAAYTVEDGSVEKSEAIVEAEMDLNKIMTLLMEEHSVKTIVNIGPGNSLLNPEVCDFSMRDVQFLDSIDMDPMLTWFWPSLKTQEPLAFAQ